MNRRNFLKALSVAVVTPTALLKGKPKPVAGIDCNEPIKEITVYVEHCFEPNKVQVTILDESADKVSVYYRGILLVYQENLSA